MSELEDVIKQRDLAQGEYEEAEAALAAELQRGAKLEEALEAIASRNDFGRIRAEQNVEIARTALDEYRKTAASPGTDQPAEG